MSLTHHLVDTLVNQQSIHLAIHKVIFLLVRRFTESQRTFQTPCPERILSFWEMLRPGEAFFIISDTFHSVCPADILRP